MPQQRSVDLLNQMTLGQKVGQMSHPPVTIAPDLPLLAFHLAMGRTDSPERRIFDQHISHFNIYGNPSPAQIAAKVNRLQAVAATTALSIPLSISSDPLYEVERGGGIAAFSIDGFSQWPSQLGFAATRDPQLVRRFGAVAAAEYRAVGITTALHPMGDLATEPRWSRNFGTFGSNAALSSGMTLAYMQGFQGDALGPGSVMTMVKHFPGGGPQLDGRDPHLPSGAEQVLSGG